MEDVHPQQNGRSISISLQIASPTACYQGLERQRIPEDWKEIEKDDAWRCRRSRRNGDKRTRDELLTVESSLKCGSRGYRAHLSWENQGCQEASSWRDESDTESPISGLASTVQMTNILLPPQTLGYPDLHDTEHSPEELLGLSFVRGCDLLGCHVAMRCTERCCRNCPRGALPDD